MNQYEPWKEKGQTELQYFKERYIQARVREHTAVKTLVRIRDRTILWRTGRESEILKSIHQLSDQTLKELDDV